MSDAPLFEDSRNEQMPDQPQRNAPDDPTTATNDSNVGTIAGTTGPTPLTGAQIVDATEDDPDAVT